VDREILLILKIGNFKYDVCALVRAAYGAWNVRRILQAIFVGTNQAPMDFSLRFMFLL
jgi:hypothetical protein